MSSYIRLAKSYSKKGYSVIPVTSEKVPAIKEWRAYQKRPMTDEECERHFKRCWGIGLLCGGEKGITGFDADLKYDLSGDIFDRFRDELPKELWDRLYMQSTKSSGYHLLFSCKKVENNQKLASRYTTEYEKHHTYMEAFNNVHTRPKALKIALNDKVRVLFETRGEGGYVVMAPSPSYSHISGKIQEVTEQEYDLIMETARKFNDVKEVRKNIKIEKYSEWKLSPFEDFNKRFDIVYYLEENGWEIVASDRRNVRLKRAGNPSSKSSALFDNDSRVFNCFSTSTLFDVNRGYTPADIFIEMECDGDTSEAFKKMIEMEYGEQ